MLFEDLGFTYLGPVNGHDLPELLNTLQQTKHLDGPVFLHVLTTKGKGYIPAEQHRSRLHGVSAFDLASGEEQKSAAAGPTFTQAFGETMCRLAAQDSRLVAITAAMCDGTGLDAFQQKFPDRFFDVGMAEEHAVTLAAGMACEGMRPVTAIYSTFSQRAYDQLVHDVCLQNLPVLLALDRAGLVGEDGPTHHGVFDLSYLRTMPNMMIMAPATLEELSLMCEMALHQQGPCAIRYPKGPAKFLPPFDLTGLMQGKAAILRQGEDVALLAIGSMTPVAAQVADLLAKQDISACVVNARFVKPLDKETLLTAIHSVRRIVTLEENATCGGFGAAVLEMLASEGLQRPLTMLGMPDSFVGQGPRDLLLDRLGLSSVRIAASIVQLLKIDRVSGFVPSY
jgi:1-deoxy-D-xylulose-5-phosphate synthase